jgi:hypothetical protein
MKYWIVASKHARDVSTSGWDSKWTTNSFLRTKQFFPSKNKNDFNKDDICILRVFVSQQLIAEFKINSKSFKDNDGDTYYEIEVIEEWDFPIDINNLPKKYKLFGRQPNTIIDEQTYHQLIGIKNFLQNIKINWKNILHVKISERDLEDLLDSVKNPLKREGIDIIERQYEITPGNKIDLICKDRKGDIVVVELKKSSSIKTIGQLARYKHDVEAHYAKPTQKVSGLILSLDIDEDLIKAARGVGFDVMLYRISFD